MLVIPFITLQKWKERWANLAEIFESESLCIVLKDLDSTVIPRWLVKAK